MEVAKKNCNESDDDSKEDPMYVVEILLARRNYKCVCLMQPQAIGQLDEF